VKMILSLIVLFAVCFFPNHVFFIWFHFDPNSHDSYNYFWHYFRIVGFCLCFVNSCINPIALYIISDRYRNHFKRMLCCCRLSQVTEQYGSSNSSRPTYPLPLHNRIQFDTSNTSSTETSREQVQLHNLALSEGQYP
jgi:Na+/serine symporter